ncbi:MAG: hypothetical protein HON90_00795, partial [Halobacteriovoraceae bacterium]|nr:hypothetical protein [Halobacteriovoraceae bacterium]
MIPSDTILANFVRNFGEETLTFMVKNLYPSAIFQIIIYGAGVAMFLYTSISLYQAKLHRYVTLFWLTWFMALPIQNKPVFYVLVNNFSSLVSTQLQKTTYDLMTHFGTKNSYPPGFVAETIMKASMSKITDPGISKAIGLIIDNCVPFGDITEINGKKRPINASDLFRVKIKGSFNDVSSFELPFEASLLKNRKFHLGVDQTDCHSFLLSTLSRLYNHLNNKGITSAAGKLYVGPMNGELNHKWIDKWSKSDYSRTNLGKTALNLAAASAIQAQILNNYFGTDLEFQGSSVMDGNTSPLIEMQKQLMGSMDASKLTFNIMNLPNAVMRSFNTDHYYNNATKLIELNERLTNLPYYISSILVFLKIILPLVIFTPFVMGSFKVVSIWGLSYLMSLVIPWIMMISRSVCNIVLLHSLNIEKTSTLMSSDPSYLKLGVDFSAVSNMLDDTGRFLSTYINIENALWASILVIIPFVSWFASGATSRAGSFLAGRASGAMQSYMQGQAKQGMGHIRDFATLKFSPNSA